MLQNIMNSPSMGLDTESIPAFNSHETSTLSIIQIALNYTVIMPDEDSQLTFKLVYILDVLSLQKVPTFLSWFANFCCKYRGRIIGHTVRDDFMTMARVLAPQLDSSKLGSTKIVDIAE